MKKSLKENVEAAAEALSDLNTFHCVISLMEGGHLHAPSYKAAERIIKICKSEAHRRLCDYEGHSEDAVLSRRTDFIDEGQ